MTDAERALLDAVLSLRDAPYGGRPSEELLRLKRTVATERLNAEYPGWYKDFFNLGVPHLLAERKFNRLKSRLDQAGVINQGLWEELFAAADRAEKDGL